MVLSPAASFAPAVLSQDAAQAHTQPAIQRTKGGPVAVLEVLEPAAKHWVEPGDYLAKTPPLGSARLVAQGVFELVQALLARPFQVSLKVITQEVKTPFLRRVHDPRLVRMHGQPVGLRPLDNEFQRPLGVGLVPALNDKVVRIPGHCVALRRQQMIQRIQVQVSQQRTDDSSYTVDNFEFLRAIPFQRPQPYAKADDEKPV